MLIQATFALGFGLLSSCSKSHEEVRPAATQQSANNVPCETCPPDDGDNGGGGDVPCGAPDSGTSARLVRQATLYARDRGWTQIQVIVGTEGCNYVYPFSINYVHNGLATWTSGMYDANSNTVTVGN